MVKHYKPIQVPEELHAKIKVKAASRKKTIVGFLEEEFGGDDMVVLSQPEKKKDNGRSIKGVFDFQF